MREAFSYIWPPDVAAFMYGAAAGSLIATAWLMFR